jgi:Fe-S-cluster containining protein
MGECKRRGYCCRDVRLAEPPELLERAYHFWKKSASIDPNFSEIYLIYPMLEFLFEKKEEDLPYHYRCRYFTHDETGLPTCAIHPIRPRMCRDFPYYEDVTYLDTSGPLSPYEGCGYNDPD